MNLPMGKSVAARQEGARRGHYRLTLRGLRRILIGEYQEQLVKTTLPNGLLLARDAALPLTQVEHAVASALGLREEPKRVVPAPQLAAQWVSDTCIL